jgi:nitroreductase
MTPEVLQAIRTRRVVRHMTAEPIDRAQLIEVLKAARWAPNAGNRRLHRFVVIQRPDTVRLVRMVAPGMFQHPAAIVVICIDWRRATQYGMPRQNTGVGVDVGTALQTMLLAAHALGLGAGPVTSFSKAAVGVLLNLPHSSVPRCSCAWGIPRRVVPRPCVHLNGSPGRASPTGRLSLRTDDALGAGYTVTLAAALSKAQRSLDKSRPRVCVGELGWPADRLCQSPR